MLQLKLVATTTATDCTAVGRSTDTDLTEPVRFYYKRARFTDMVAFVPGQPGM